MNLLTQIHNDITLKQFLDIYIIPEIEKRKNEKIIGEDFELISFQILFSLSKSVPEIRLNEECKIVANIKVKEGIIISKGEPIHWDDVESVISLKLEENDDGDCGHVSYIYLGNNLVSSFDFRYNKKTIKQRIEISRQFLDTAKFALDNGFYNVYVDNIFSATEIASQACLLILPDKNFLAKTNHKAIKSKLNWWSSLGNIDMKFSTVLNQLSVLRNNERYFNGETTLTNKDESKEYIESVDELIKHVELTVK